MPKMKTKRAACKRFKTTATGKIRFARGFKNHILTNKTRKMKRHAKALGVANVTQSRKMRRLIGQD